MEQKKLSWLNPLIIGLCIVISCISLAFGLAHFRSESAHVITATGSASVDFEADIIIWRGYFSATAYTSQDAYNIIKSEADQVKKYLLANNLTEDEVVFNSVDISQIYRDIYDDNGNYIGSEADGYRLTQSVTITSSNIDNVEKISRDISSLLDLGVEFTSESPEYYYSGLDDLKLDLIDKASTNAKDRIDIIAKNSGARLGKLKNSSLGVFQITAKNSGTSSYSYDGAFDTGSRYKTATITVRLEYDLK
ncbi:SIMPL domain-containing protein [Butyrivibrio proteoclasticus]|uniref:SIMPL domain-containing protein n=1 Tax=Butyrivibrio proteoclasticus TaxID=43305 RepID=UPI00047B7238|nr:SIMPL domain-containing protein [Butyrivibrio proteoclasticus]